MKTVLRSTFALALLLSADASFAQSIPFTNQTSLLPTTTYRSGNAIGVVDMNNDQKDDIVRSDNTTMSICYQNNPNDSFTEQTYTYNLSSPWGMCVADVNNDGIRDALFGDNGSTRMLVWNGTGYTGTNVSSATSAGYIFVQGCNYFDINNDAFVDAFVCADTDTNHIYWNNGGTGWTYNALQTNVPGGCGIAGTGNSFDGSGNYASVWSDVNNDGLCDLMITHCRQSVSQSSDWRRVDQIYINNGDGTFTQDITNWTGLRDGAQGWSTSFGDIDNDGDMDAFVLNYDVNSKLMINNGSGVFTDAMSGSGISNTTSFFGMNATFHDFDNDTYVDLFLTGDNHYLYKNNGNGTFTLVSPNPFSYSSYTMTSHGVGDLNGDGFLDIYGSYCDVYNTPSTRNDKLWMNDAPNQGNTNHWIKFDLVGQGTAGFSNRDGVGAIVKVYGPWGVQVRVIHSGEGYGIQNSMRVHFGLGSATQIDSLIILWPSGVVDMMLELPADAAYNVPEGGFPLATSTVGYHAFRMMIAGNPMVDQTTITLFNADDYGFENLTMEVFDMNGRIVYVNNSITGNTVVLNSSMFTSGMYMVQVRNGDQRLATERMMVQ